jgi:hypothetical protein
MGGGIYTPAELTVTEFPAERGFYNTNDQGGGGGLDSGPEGEGEGGDEGPDE